MPIGYTIGSFIGLEIETATRSLESAASMVGSLKPLSGWKVEHDGSIESHRFKFYGLEKYAFVNMWTPNLHTTKVGAEFVSPVINTNMEGWKKNIRNICRILKDAGEISDRRCSLHVHVNVANVPVYILQNIIRIWQRIEAMVYRLSVGELAEGIHRGAIRQNYLYCRPLDHPQVIFDGYGNLRHVFSVDGLLAAETIPEFFQALGNTPVDRDPSKYQAARYSAINFHNYVKSGSFELRTPNLTLNPNHIIAYVELAKAIVRTALMGKWDETLPLMPLGDRPEFTPIDLQGFLTLPDEVMPAIFNLYNSADWQDGIHSEVLTHAREGLTVDFGGVRKELQPPILKIPVISYYEKYGDEYFEFSNQDQYREIIAVAENQRARRR